jgi:hypothetical protein
MASTAVKYITILRPKGSYLSTILGTAPIALWPLSETSGTDAVDATGNNHAQRLLLRASVGCRTQLGAGSCHLVGRVALQLLLRNSLTGATKGSGLYCLRPDAVALDVALTCNVPLG